ncbi:MAG: DUF4363 family protein, partial [Firmicutes bacterium]|nr:DUF4363 family protein [Bacillota bacterium]
LWFTTAFLTDTHKNLENARVSIEANEDNLDNPETIRLCQKANDDWEKGKKTLMMLMHHNVVRYTDEKFVSLLEQIRLNNKDDACVTVKVLISYVKDLREENYPIISNIL